MEDPGGLASFVLEGAGVVVRLVELTELVAPLGGGVLLGRFGGWVDVRSISTYENTVSVPIGID